MSDQSIIDDARNWREVVRDLAECGYDPHDITPEWLISIARNRIHVAPDYFAPEYAGRCYEDVEWSH